MRLIFSFICLFAGIIGFAQQKITVAADGSGNYTTVQAAIDALPDDNKQTIVIFIKNGIYKERLKLASSKKHVRFIGEDAAKTLLTFDNYASRKDSAGREFGTTNSASFFIDGEDISFENISFENAAGPVGQAVAVNIRGTRVAFKNCRFLGFQDTVYTKNDLSILYFKSCFIEGTVDFIFGAATAFFEDCIIAAKSPGYLTAASTPENHAYGYVFVNCKLTGTAPENSVYLGRPWRPNAKTVFINCVMDKHVKKEGWNNWGKTTNEQTTFYGEYNSRGDGAATKERVSWSHQLTKAEAENYTIENVLAGWKPSFN